MASTLTWANSGIATKTGSSVTNLIDDIVNAVNGNSANAEFYWKVASYDNTDTVVKHVTLKRKDNSVGRILIVIPLTGSSWNDTIITAHPLLSTIYVTYFPNGNIDTPVNISNESGTIMGDDTGVLKVVSSGPVPTSYGAGSELFYFDSQAGVVFGFYKSNASSNGFGAGELVVDNLDNAYPCAFGTHNDPFTSMGCDGISTIFDWSGTRNPNENSDVGLPTIRVNYNGDNKLYFEAFVLSSGWGNQIGSPDVLSDEANNKAYFMPIYLIGQTAGEGLVLKFRQIAFGPGSLVAFDTFETAGPVVQAIQWQPHSVGDNSAPWFVNFKI